MALSTILDKHLPDMRLSVNSIQYLQGSKVLTFSFEADALMMLDRYLAFEAMLKEAFESYGEVSVAIKTSGVLTDVQLPELKKWFVHCCVTLMPSIAPWLSEDCIEMSTEVITSKISDTVSFDRIQTQRLDLKVAQELERLTGYKLRTQFNLDEAACRAMTEELEQKKEEHLKAMIKVVETVGNNEARNPGAQKPSKPKAESGFGGGFNGGGGGPRQRRQPNEVDETCLYRNKIRREVTKIAEGMEEEGIFCFEAQVFEVDSRDLKSGKCLVSFSITDFTNSIGVKLFVKDSEEKDDLLSKIKKGGWYKFEGSVRYDTFEKELALYAMNINTGKGPAPRMDNAEEKRIELHCHTTMSDMDGVTGAKDLVKRAMSWGHKALAITDHGVLQAFPEAMETARGKDFKVIYGVEGYLMNDDSEIAINPKGQLLNDEFIVFDIETTGLSFKHHKITEIGAVKIKNGAVVDRFSALVNPEVALEEKIVELTGITDDMLRDQPLIEDVLPRFMDFVGDSVLVAHNASFDTAFIKENCRQIGLAFDFTVLDTLTLSRLLLKDLKRHRLNMIAKHLGISLENHHRAVDDAEATAQIFLRFVDMLKAASCETLDDINLYAAKNMDYQMMDTYHVIILVKDYKGLKNLYQLVSHSNLQTFYKKPRIPKSMLSAMREGLIIGTACEAGELFSAIASNKSQEEIDEIVAYYDYLEIQPIGNNAFLIEKGFAKDEEELRNLNRRVIELGEKFDKPVVATCDVHFMDPEDEVFRRILMAGQGFSDADKQAPLYFRTTEEMLREFDYLGKDKAYEVVVRNTNKIADQIENILPIPDETYPPIIEGSDDDLRRMCMEKARNMYGQELPEVVESRLVRELDSIIKNGYAVMYIIAHKLVAKSLEDGYLVGSRGSVGSSLAATMSGITEVNPLPPHYRCINCLHSEFILDGSIGSGADLPDKDCPKCGSAYKKDGHDIPFETFLGFEGDKEPDIDLNFAGVYQATAHKYTEELFGTGYVYKAGTIGTIADKTAYGYVKKYFEEKNITVNSKEIARLSQGCTGIKRTSGQHPGGIMVVPSYKDIHDFCPIQYPANDSKSGVITTHFDYHSISGRILKLDILGHDVPTIIKALEDMTGVKVEDIPLDDKATVAIFTTTDTLNIQDPSYRLKIGSLGIPEFGTKFVRQMLDDTQPSTFAELVRISGLSHGTDVWINNAQDLVRRGEAVLKDVISTRDDIMTYLIYQGLPPKSAFNIMERVRKGKGLVEENIELMKQYNVPDWYIWSCNQIKYMFPKAHAVAYVMMSFRIAYFKVHYPLAFYASFFSTKVEDFDAQLVCQGKDVVRSTMKQFEQTWDVLSKKEQDLYGILEVVDEYYSRGFEFHRVSLEESHSDDFRILDGKLLPPLRALQGVGETAARKIVEERALGEFISIDELKRRAKATKTVIEALDQHGCLKDMPENNQLSLFSFA